MGGRLCLRTALDRPDVVEALVLIGATAGHRGPRGAGRAPPVADEALADRLEQVGMDAFIEEWLAAAAVRRAPGLGPLRSRTSHQHRRGAGREPPPRRHRLDGAAVGPARSSSSVPVLCITGAVDERYGGARRTRGRRAIGAERPPRGDRRRRPRGPPGAAGRGDGGRHGGPRRGAGDLSSRGGSAAEEEPDREQCAVDHLHLPGAGEHRDQAPAPVHHRARRPPDAVPGPPPAAPVLPAAVRSRPRGTAPAASGRTSSATNR